MSWTNLDIKLQPRVSHCNITVSRTPVSSLHVPNLPATRGAVDFAQVNTGGVLEPNRNFTPWGTWTQGGLNTCKVTGDTLLKLSGYGWQSADGGLEVESGMRRFRFTLSRLTGAVQIGVSAARGRSDEIPDTWNDPAMVDRAWFMTGSGNLHNGSIRVFQTGKKLREGDVVGVEVRLDEAEVTFRKLHSSKCGDHVFGTHCQACVDGFKTRGEEPPAGFMPRRACLLWNADGPKDDDGSPPLSRLS
ncbi:hypothetical protein T484DRAFT_2941048 [Baffinella frigidus]|nr:hypothetical protein T484DRAFT_2941048 [Cryptophyta sp. CCMP2293]